MIITTSIIYGGQLISDSNDLLTYNNNNVCIEGGNYSSLNNIIYITPNSFSDLKTQIESGESKIIIIPKGNYTFTNNISIPSNIEIIGSGESSILYLDAGESFLLGSGVENISLKNIKAIGTSSNEYFLKSIGNVQNNIYIENIKLDSFLVGFNLNVSKFQAHNNIITNTRKPFAFSNSALTTEKFIQIENNYLEGEFLNVTESEAVELNLHDNTAHAECQINNNMINGFSEQGIDFNCHSGTIIGNSIFMYGSTDSTGIQVRTQGQKAELVTITGNKIKDYVTNGIQIRDSYYISVVGNVIEGKNLTVGAGIYLHTDNAEYLNVVGNVITRASLGIDDDSGTAQIIGNQFFNVTNEYDYSGTLVNDFGGRIDGAINFLDNIGINIINPESKIHIYDPAPLSTAQFTIQGLGAGDVGMVYEMYDGTTLWAQGIDNNQNDEFCLGHSAEYVSGATKLICLQKTNEVRLEQLASSYTGGSAYLCVDNDGDIFASETACP